MTPASDGYRVDWDARLVEEAVLRSVRGSDRDRSFHLERDACYEIADVESRDAAFRKCHADWFVRLNLDRPVLHALSERPRVKFRTDRCAVTVARSKKQEGADLFVNPNVDPSTGESCGAVGIQLRPESLLDPEGLLALLRHEFLHLDDMLDPAFGYGPALPPSEAGPTFDRLLQDRYRSLWDATIDGRLVRTGLASASLRDRRLQDFVRTFPMFGERTPSALDRLFAGGPHTHGDLVAFAQHPELLLRSSSTNHRDACCPICRFPSYDFEPDPTHLPADLLAAVMIDFPRWRPNQGICRQCSELYRSRPLSIADLALMPKSA